jgi:hypothetical protein
MNHCNIRHEVHNALRDSPAILFTSLSIGVDKFVYKLPERFLKGIVRLETESVPSTAQPVARNTNLLEVGRVVPLG